MLVAAIAVAIGAGWFAIVDIFSPQDASATWQRDCDRALIHQGLIEHPRFVDTLEWWIATWVGEVPFWRPLSSLVFWVEWKVFGWGFQDAWTLIHFLLHLVACSLFYLLVVKYTRSPLVGLAAIFLTVSNPPRIGNYLWSPDRPAAVAQTLWSWKNTPDTLMACMVFWGLLVVDRRPWLALVLMAAAAATKETGFAGLAVLAGYFAWRRRKELLVAAVGVLVAEFAVRFQAVGVGYVMGTNVHMLARAARALIPAQVMALSAAGQAPFIILGFSAAGALLVPRRWRLAVLVGGVGLAVAIFAVVGLTAEKPYGLLSAVAGLIDKGLWVLSVPAALWLFGALRGFCPGVVLASGLYVAFAAPCTIAPQVMLHAYYTASYFSGAAVALAWQRVFLRSDLARTVSSWALRSSA